MDGLEELQSLSALAKVTEMLKNYLDLDQPELAEFVIHLAKKAQDVEDFNKLLDENEANMSYDFVNQLYRTIIALDPPKKDEWDDIISQNKDELNFPALNLKNDPNREELKLTETNNELSEWARELLDKEDGSKAERERSRKKSEPDRRSRSKLKELMEEEVYLGKVVRVSDFGIFVEFETLEGFFEGMVHASEVSERRRVEDLQKFARRGDEVYVKVLSILEGKSQRNKYKRINLTMKYIDQKTGRDSHPTPSSREAFEDLPTEGEDSLVLKKRKYLSDMDRWENQQLLNSGVLDKGDRHKLREELLQEEEKEPEIELITNPPNFLKGQTIRSGIVLSPIKLVAKPEGSLSRTIQSSLQIQKENKMLSYSNAESESKNETSDSAGLDFYKNAFGGKGYPESHQRVREPVASISQQRRNLPIFKFKVEIVDKIIENKILIIIGETGSGKTTQIPQYLYESNFCNYNHFLDIINAHTDNDSALSNREHNNNNTNNSDNNYNNNNKDSRDNKDNNNNIKDNNYKDSRDNKDNNNKEYKDKDKDYKDGREVRDRRTAKRMIGITQPRRVSCISVAKRVSEEMGFVLGNEVGYSIRFNDVTSSSTVIKFMTDGMLLREILHDPLLSNYVTIMLDEAHERTIATDVLFALLKETCMKRNDFRLIVTSATLESAKFSKYFCNAQILKIPGKIHPVEVLHVTDQQFDYLESALTLVLNIHLNEKPGDILLFLTGQEDIENGYRTLNERLKKLENLKIPPLVVLPIYAALPNEFQERIFSATPPGTRKCVLATNIAEASITIDGILYVIDPGLCKVKSYNPKTGMESLIIAPISQANAKQRAGRAGRTAPGKCYRLYSEKTYLEEMLPTPVPEIQRVNLLNVVIILKSMGINDFIHFDFMDRPSNEMLIDSLDVLFHLGALDDEGLLTRLGRKMAQFPIDPTFSKVILTSIELDCYEDVVTIVSMLSVQNVFYRPPDKKEQSDQRRSRFFETEGDHLTYLNVYRQWQRNNFSSHFCYQNFLQYRALVKVQEIKKQLTCIVDKYRFHGGGRSRSNSGSGEVLRKSEAVQKSLCSGFFHHSARRHEECYRTLLDDQQVHIHPSSSLYKKNPEYVIYNELVLTTKEYMRDLTVVRAHWLPELAPTMFKQTDVPTKGRKRGDYPEKILPLHSKRNQADPDAWRLSKRRL